MRASAAFRLPDHIQPAQVWAQRLRHHHAAVRLRSKQARSHNTIRVIKVKCGQFRGHVHVQSAARRSAV